MRIGIGRMLEWMILAALLSAALACNDKAREADVKPITPIIKAHEDVEGLSNYMTPPVPVRQARRVAVPLSSGRSEIGPTDLTVYILVHVEESDWPSWLAAFGEPKRRTAYHLPKAVSEALLPPELAAGLPLDDKGRLIDGVFYDPGSMAVSGNRGVLAIRIGSELLLVFTST